jgi:hypothetical protein
MFVPIVLGVDAWRSEPNRQLVHTSNTRLRADTGLTAPRTSLLARIWPWLGL